MTDPPLKAEGGTAETWEPELAPSPYAALAKVRYLLKWSEDGEFLRRDGQWPQWGPGARGAKVFRGRERALKVKRTWPMWCRRSIRLVRAKGD